MKGQRQSRETIGRIAKAVQADIESKHHCKTYVAGSYRREVRGVGDLDIIAVDPRPIFAKISKIVDCIQVDIRGCKASELGAMLLYFTGSKWHNIKLRKRAIKYGCNLNEYGLWRMAYPKSEKLIHAETETGIYAALGIP